MKSSPYGQSQNAYDAPFEQTYLLDDIIQTFNLSMPDDVLDKMLIGSLDDNVEFWDQEPWQLRKVDVENVKYFLGNQLDDKQFLRSDSKYIDNRLFSSIRAVLSYATGQLAKPAIVPSRSDDEYLKMARRLQQALYQHAADEYVDVKTRAAVTNLLLRKRGPMKLRYDPFAGLYGDVVTEVANPEDVIVDRFAPFMGNPRIIYHRIRCTVDELCAKFPSKQAQIYSAYSMKRGVYTQMSRMVTYFEAWFTYLDNKKLPKEGVAWFIPEHHIILDKMPNPNWIYTGNDGKDKQTNVLFAPPKPFIWFNYINLGHSYIDETSLFDQAKPQQDMLNTRGQQFNDNISYMNGRWVMSKAAVSEEDATKFINKGSKTILLVNGDDVGKAAQVMTPNQLPQSVYESIQDFRNEIDGIVGTPSVFKGSNPSSQDTLGRDMLLKQQAGMLQDDLVRAVQLGMEDYYQKLLQMMRVYYTDDYWFQVKGGDGKFDFIMLNGDNIDSNVKINVQIDSTLPLDKDSIRATAIQLAQMGRIDDLTLLEDIGLPDPEIRAERLERWQLDRYTYMQSIEQSMTNGDAEMDIDLLLDGKIPTERDDYNQDYINYFNHYVTLNKFQMLTPQQKQAIVQFLKIVQIKAAKSADLQLVSLNDAGIMDQPPLPPMPKKTENIKLQGDLSPQQTSQLSGVQAPPGQTQQTQQQPPQQSQAPQGTPPPGAPTQ